MAAAAGHSAALAVFPFFTCLSTRANKKRKESSVRCLEGSFPVMSSQADRNPSSGNGMDSSTHRSVWRHSSNLNTGTILRG